MTKKKKKKNELKPEMLEQKGTADLSELKQIAEHIQKTTYVEPKDDENSDSFFKHIVKELFDTTKNVSAKTEYVTLSENFTGAKLEYLATLGNIPYLKKFITILEIKRISLERKGRKEIILALKEREQEIRNQQMQNMGGMLGTN